MSSTMLSLMDVQSSLPEQFDPVLGSRINDLLETCVSGTSALREELRRNRLRVCMRTLWYFAKEYNTSTNTTPLPSYFRDTFGRPEMTNQIQSEEDIAARLIGRSFSSLIVQKLARDTGSCIAQGQSPIAEELSCLADLLGKTNEEVVALLGQPGAINLANIISLTSSEMNILVKERVPSEVQDIFLKTLDLLLADDIRAIPNAELPPGLAAVFQETSPLGRRLRAPDLRVDLLKVAS
ncbi:hypothetical protein EI94DRAFT_1822632 [Lactarius quietus]|nr:hypothetical protein EI94DRAFT_1822632 [Lactarius quietus]